jgi:nucleoside-diphosphate-sugar epimerase
MSRLAAAGNPAIGVDPLPALTTHVIDDLSDRERLRSLLRRERVTQIIHAGRVSGPMVMPDDPAAVISINMTGGMNLLYAAMDSGLDASCTAPRSPRSEVRWHSALQHAVEMGY